MNGAQSKGVAPTVSPLGQIEWLETQTLRVWLAGWLLDHWENVYWDSWSDLIGERWHEAATGMPCAMKRLRRRLGKMTTAGQLAAVDEQAAKFGLRTDMETLLFELEDFLEKYGLAPENAEAFKASPFCNAHAVGDIVRRHAGYGMGAKFYLGKPELQIALKTILTDFFAVEIMRGPTPNSRARRNQQALAAAVRRLCRGNNRPTQLAAFIAKFFRDEWPRYLWDLESQFSREQCLRLAASFQPTKDHSPAKTKNAMARVLWMSIFRKELRDSFLRLADDAENRPRKGWQHFSQALTGVFEHIARRPSKQQLVTEELIASYPQLRNEKNSVVAQLLNQHLDLLPSAKFNKQDEGKTSVDVMIRRARKKMKAEHGLD